MKTKTYINKLTAWLLTFAMIMTFVPSFAITASAATYSGITGNVYWEFEDGTLTISGEGSMAGYSNTDPLPWPRESVKTVVIEDGVKSIGSYAFYYCTNLISVSIPASVTSIGSYAFYCCENLTSVTISGSVTTIGNNAFRNCSSLTTVNYLGKVEPLGNKNIFSGCNSLLVVNVPEDYESANDTFCGVPVNVVESKPTTYTVSVSANLTEGGTVTGGGNYSHGDTVTLTATACDGYAFVNWTENDTVVSAEATYTFTIVADRTLTAVFEQEAVAHAHDFIYTVNNNIITETCDNGCEHNETATLKAPTSEIVYDGTAKESATVIYSEGWQGGELTITYENNINAGTVTAKITKATATATVNFVINAAESNEETPTSLTAIYDDTLADVTLPSGWAWKDSSLSVGDVGSKTFKAVFTPSSSNYKTIEADVTVVVEQATPSYTVPMGLTATYGLSFYSISLPSGWSWRAPTAKVGDVGVHQYSAYYTPTDPNYKQVMVELTVTVTKAPLTVKANNHSITYGDAPANGGVEYEGFAYGDDESVLNGTLTYDYNYVRYGNVGVYDITPKGLTADNYEITFIKGSLTVEQKVLDIEWSNTEVVYNGHEQAPTATPIGTVNGDQISIEVSTAKDTDSYTVVVHGIRGAKADNYKFAQQVVTHSFKIQPKEITVTWGNSVFVYDGTKKFPEIFLNGIISGDNVQAVTSGAQINVSDVPYTATVTDLSGTDANNYKLIGTLTKEFTIAKAGLSAPANITKTDETIFGKRDGTISGITATMEYRKEGEIAYSLVNSSVLEGLAPGKYYIRYQGDGNHNPSIDTVITILAGRKLTVTVPQNQVGYTLTVDKTEIEYMDGPKITLHIANGYSKTDNFVVKINGVDMGWGDWTEIETQSFTTDAVITVEGVADITAPTAEIDIKGNKWTSFLNTITFGLFFNETQDVTIAVNDSGSGTKTIEYYLSNETFSETQVKAITEWVSYNGTFKINPDNKFVVYVKVTDYAGNVTYISSDGVVLDMIAALITGIENGGTYYGDTTITVTDALAGVEYVKVDGADVLLYNGQYTIVADNAEHTIKVGDKAGNVVEYQVTVYKNYVVTFKADGEVVETVTVGYGKDSIMPTIPAKNGYDQIAPVWDKDGKNITTDTEINAVYIINKYTVTIPSEQIGYTLETDVKTIEHGGEVYISIVPKEGYEKTDKFAVQVNGVAVELTEYSNVVVTATEDLVITVEGIELKTYTITFMDENGVYKTLTYKHGESVTMPEVPTKEGYTGKWEKTIDKATGDVTVKAVYTEIPKDDEPEDKPEDKPLSSPETGDNSNLWLWFALAFVSGGMFFGTNLWKRKEEAKEH